MTSIFYETLPVARLTMTDELRLDYDPSWEARTAAFPLSLSMPLHAGSFGASMVMPWLANLLPETHLSEIGQRLKVSPQDIVGILNHIGRDTAGAFSIGAPRKPGLSLRPVANENALERILNELPAKPFLVGDRGVSMSLAGVQEKLPVFVADNGKISIPLEGAPSTHIIKPDSTRLAGSVENEAYCLALARHCGLDAAEARMGHAGERRYLLVRRYDRFIDEQKQIRRLHQEDLCQLTGHFPAQKYQRSTAGSGITLKQMFTAIGDFISPGERLKLLDAVIFNILICNSDSHAKNYSVLIGAGGSAKFAPLYDLMCASIYKNVDQNLPQSIAGKYVATELHQNDWKVLAHEVGLSPASTLRRVDELGELIERHAEDVAHDIARSASDASETLDRITHEVRKRCRRIRRQLQ